VVGKSSEPTAASRSRNHTAASQIPIPPSLAEFSRLHSIRRKTQNHTASQIRNGCEISFAALVAKNMRVIATF
ncbi:hypothetical protein, partial [uncultured Campylobacter sp.]|uniref:hypothetical protein n=1 Tax=uncultured Campylobacter sp. TaxID=218934 RepID=UPI0026399452